MPSAVVAVLVAGLAGQLSAAAVGALPWPVLVCSAVLYVLGATLAVRTDERWASTLRRAGSALALAVAVLLLLTLPRPPDPQLFKGSLGLMLVGAQVGQALGWRHSRDLHSGLVTALGLLVLGASFAPDILVGIPLLIGWVAVLVALGQLHGARPVLPATAVAVVLGLVAFLLVPVPVSAGLRSRFAAASVPTRDAQGARVFSGDTLDLRQRGRLGTDPVASVPADSPALWRSSSFDSYDGTRWTRPSGGDLVRGPRFTVSEAAVPSRRDDVVLKGTTDGTIWSPGTPLEVEAAGVEAGFVNDLGDVALPGVGRGYTVTSEVAVTDPLRLRSRQGEDLLERRWREVPADLPERVSALAREITAATTNRYDAAEAIARWLREHATYRLDSPVPAAGEDAVDRFLFVDRVGFCEQFASAEVVLLRSLGIPARLVTGLAYGVPDAGARLYRVADLHAWVELWIPGVGWVSSDPTAGVPLAGGATGVGLRARLAGALTSGLTGLTRLPGGRPVLALALLLLVAVVGSALSRRPATRRTAEGQVSGGPALQAFLRLDARLGVRRRRPGESLRELSTRLDPSLVEALGVVEQECYAPYQPDPRAAVEVLDRA